MTKLILIIERKSKRHPTVTITRELSLDVLNTPLSRRNKLNELVADMEATMNRIVRNEADI